MLNESKRILELAGINEATKSKYSILHSSFSSAVQEAEQYTKMNGYEIDEDDWFNNITTGRGRPKDGKTFSTAIVLKKNGKEQRKRLQIQVYNRGQGANPFELNCYIS